MNRPILENGLIIFDNCSTSLKLGSCQRTASLICSDAIGRTDTKVLLEHLEWGTLAYIRNLSKTTLFYKIIYLFAETNSALFVQKSLHQPTTHTEPKKHWCRCRLKLHKKSFFQNCIAIWNTLPNHIKTFPKQQYTKRTWKSIWIFGPKHWMGIHSITRMAVYLGEF